MRSDAPIAGRHVVVAASAVVALVAAIGCERARVEDSAVDKFPRSAEEMDFLDALNQQTVVTNDDALHALIAFADGADLSSTYAGRVEVAKRKQWIDASWDRPGDESAQVGWMAVAGVRILDVKGGLSLRLLGPTPRYATKELVFMDILPLRTENQSLSGREFVDYVNRLGRVQRSGRAIALREQQEGQAGVGVIPAGSPNQLIDQSSVEFGLPSTAFTTPNAPAPQPIALP
ncbi:MAG: hypothetical protein RI990_388 [Planctomycetota bacterium]|jgi:hypothetical protein